MLQLLLMLLRLKSFYLRERWCSLKLRPKVFSMAQPSTYFYYWPSGHANKSNRKPLVTCTDLSVRELISVTLTMRSLVASLTLPSTMVSSQEQVSRSPTALGRFFGEYPVSNRTEKELSLWPA